MNTRLTARGHAVKNAAVSAFALPSSIVTVAIRPFSA